MTRYNSLQEALEEWDKEIKKHPIRNWIIGAWRLFITPYKMFFDFLIEIKWFIQRGKNGWAIKDTWNIDMYLAKIIPEMIMYLKKTGHALPTWTEDKTEEQAEKEWNDILDDIIYAWNIRNLLLTADWYMVSSKLRPKYIKFCNEMNKKYPELNHHVMTKEECERYRKGMRFFIKYLGNLWD